LLEVSGNLQLVPSYKIEDLDGVRVLESGAKRRNDYGQSGNNNNNMNHLLCTKRDHLLNGSLELGEVNALRHGIVNTTHDC
jgi:hypothetical protein